MPNYFTMKMRGGTESPDDRKKVIDFVKETSCIGVGEPEYTKGAGTFQNDIQIGDIVVLRAGGRPLALMKVISDAYQYKPEGKFPDFDNWLDCVRKVKIISWYDDFSYVYFDARGYMQACAAITGDNLPIIQKWYEIAMEKTHNKSTQNPPNIFSFATSELSQDAFFAWLLSWASPQYAKYDPSLHSVAIKFAKLLTGISNLQIETINAGRSWEHIDVWAEINNNIFLSIEDKTGTSIHDNQLARYKEQVENEYPDRIKCYAYIKTENEPAATIKEVIDIGYRVILRKDILECLAIYNGNNAILCNYREHLSWLEEDTECFKFLPVDDWSFNAWKGFYTELEKYIKLNNWKYVANPAGGFLGTWWHFTDFSDGQMYLQFEQGNLCFKIRPDCEEEERITQRNKCHELLMEKARDRFPEIQRPGRFGIGEYMTIAIVTPERLFGKGIISVDDIVRKLREYEALIDECCSLK